MSGPTVPVTIDFSIDNGDETSTPFTAVISDQAQSDAAEAVRAFLAGYGLDFANLNALFQFEMNGVASTGMNDFDAPTMIAGWEAMLADYNANNPDGDDPFTPIPSDEAWAQYKVTKTAQNWADAGWGT